MLWAFGFAGFHADSIDSMMAYLSASRIIRYKSFVVLTGANTFIEADYESDWFDESSMYHAGAGLEVAGGLQYSQAGE